MDQNYEKKIIDSIGEACVLDQLAEEATELAQAALKLARIYRGINPTPVDVDDAHNKLIEEYSDVALVAHILDVYADPDILAGKKERWLKRLDDEKFKSRLRAAESERDKLMEAIRAYNDHCNPNTPKSMKYGVRK